MAKKKYDRDKWLAHIEEGINEGPFAADWDSLSDFREPDWFHRQRLGIFIHYGLYSVPAFNHEWYSRCMYIKDSPEYEHHIKTFGKHTEFGYKDFIPMLTAEKFDPKEWIELFKGAGAGYVCPVAEHHDGFQMYKSELSEWNAFDMGPHRDILGELKEEAEKQGLIFCTSSHRAE
ncbi:MAG TPA: alpha-L-fucosidase, partial [Lachnospiraceae bacterium]|nr:alpha-L-fucosidase [Lachnospiraceae bacterium]